MITLNGITLRRGNHVLLDRASLTIHGGEKVALVGRNGAGKTSLFALLDGSFHEDAGEFLRPPMWRLAQVAQETPSTSDSATDFVLAGDVALIAAQDALRLAEVDADGERLAYAHMLLDDAGAHDARARAQSLLLGLGFRVDELEQPVDSFSGGWRMRLQLARTLICPSDLLLLDEPTNHLDLDALVWLESWLKRYSGTLLVISHDREFLDAVCSTTVHLEGGKLNRYQGNYSAFEEQRAQQIELQQSAYLRQQDRIARLQSFINRFKAKATKARQAQSRVKALERIERLAPVLTSSDFSFEFKPPTHLPNPMLAIDDAAFGYPPARDAPANAPATVILNRVRRSLLPGQRIGILGANGQGKSTLVKTIAGVLACVGGSLRTARGLRVGYFAQQELEVLRPQETPLQHLQRLARETTEHGPSEREQDLRTFLGSFNFGGEKVRQAVGTMSGGEKARVVLALLVWQRPNLLLLDEPTNHLDLTTREALTIALNEFEGTVVVVSHDRALLRAVCDDFWLVANGSVQDFSGDLDDYQRYLLDEARRKRDLSRQATRANPVRDDRSPLAARKRASGNLQALKRHQEHIDHALGELQREQRLLEASLLDPHPPAGLAVIGRRLQAITDEASALEDQWLEIVDQIEAASRRLAS